MGPAIGNFFFGARFSYVEHIYFLHLFLFCSSYGLCTTLLSIISERRTHLTFCLVFISLMLTHFHSERLTWESLTDSNHDDSLDKEQSLSFSAFLPRTLLLELLVFSPTIRTLSLELSCRSQIDTHSKYSLHSEFFPDSLYFSQWRSYKEEVPTQDCHSSFHHSSSLHSTYLSTHLTSQ